LSTKLLPLLNPWSTVTENYRLMRTNLQYPHIEDDEQEGPQVLMVTSPEPADGKTTTAVNLALTFALSGHEVILIDGDLRRPTAHTLLDLNRRPGLAEVLSKKTSLDEVVQPFIDEFSFVAAGEAKAPSAEMLESKRMRELLAETRDRADVVIIDTPPVLAASDALILAVQCDATLVVANAGTTDSRALDQVKKTLGAVGVPVSAVIFNRFDAGRGQYEYGYGEGYGYDDKPDPVEA
jgi:succinoglycan biosynthesis transport protein ExoP